LRKELFAFTENKVSLMSRASPFSSTSQVIAC
jgi:hypothetical protein